MHEIKIKNNIQNFNNFLQQQLNKPQQDAVTPKDGSFLVIAGAGSGKTRVITARITNLILNHDVDPKSIVALTFTNKAAQEMHERIEQFLPSEYAKPTIATFHSYCLRLLKNLQSFLKIDNFTIIDAQDQYKLLQTIAKKISVEKEINIKSLISFIAQYKMHSTLDTDDFIAPRNSKLLMDLYNAYEHEKKISNYFDFDDLLYRMHNLLKTNSSFRKYHHEHVRHILVDEYQDTNLIQHELLKLMTLDKNKIIIVDSICAVGDEDQSIYSWRGATVRNILDFDQDFKKTKLIKLEQNYRSTQRILDIANHVITNNRDRNKKQLWSASEHHHTPLQLECLSDLQEAYAIAHAISVIAKKETLASIAVLYRTHYQSRIIEEALIKESIPYKIVGGLAFYDRKEIKDMIAYLRLIINPFDKISFTRVINCPLRGLGKKFEETFLETWAQQPFANFIDIAHKLIDEKTVTPKARTALQQFINIYAHVTPETSPTQALEHFVKTTDYPTYLQDHFDKKEAEGKQQNIVEFLRAAEYAQNKQQATLTQFLDDIALMQEQMHKRNEQTDCVQLMSLHSAKGLEFSTVILAGLEETILPSSQSIDEGRLEEERRLFYVGITRSKAKLIITHSRYRNTYGRINGQYPSRFLEEIPGSLVIQQPAVHWSKLQFKTFFKQWLAQSATQVNSTDSLHLSIQSFGSIEMSEKRNISGSLEIRKKKNVSSTISIEKNTYSTKQNFDSQRLQKASRSSLNSSKAKLLSPLTSPKTAKSSFPLIPSAAKQRIEGSNSTANNTIKRLQTVKHKSFGIGITHKVEQKGSKTYVTVNFSKHGIKKIDLSFLEII